MVFCHGSIFASVSRSEHDSPGGIWRIEVTDEYDIIGTPKEIMSVPAPLNIILGLACDPRDDDVTFKLYFSHSRVYAEYGDTPKKKFPYLGAVRF